MDFYLQRHKCFNQSILAHIGSVNYLSGAVTFPAKNTWIMCAWNIHVLWTTINTHDNEMEKWKVTRNCGNKSNYYLTFVLFLFVSDDSLTSNGNQVRFTSCNHSFGISLL